MPLRPTRSIAVFLAICGLFFSVSILESKLKSYSRGRLSIITAPSYHGSAPKPEVIEFWDQFAQIFYKARPTTPPIQLQQGLEGINLEGGVEANGERKPFERSIGISEEWVHSLAQSHLQLITHPEFDQADKEVSDIFGGTGIVTVAGGRYFAPAILSIRMLRRTNSTLPVQVFLATPDEYEPEICERVLPALNAECLVLSEHLSKSNPFKVTPHLFKVLAITLSKFQKVLYLDSDCFPLRDPAELFSTKPFTSTGLLTWPDYWIATEDPTFYQIAGLAKFPTGLPARSSEIGQFMIDKSKHLSTLLLAAYYNVFGPETYYPLLSQGSIGGGDKETFLASAAVLGKPFYRTNEHVGTIGYIDPTTSEFHGGAMIQYHPGDEWLALHGNVTEKEKLANKKPRPSFLHANSPKMNVAHLFDDKEIFVLGTDQRLRLWGDKNLLTVMFGCDIEKLVWDEMRHMACELDTVLEDFKGRWMICERANTHYREFFDNNAVDAPQKNLGAT